jgi:transcriptional regulator with XRE-family HTH domain
MDLESLKKQIDWCHMEFFEQLKELRESKGLTQTQVADTLGIAKNTYIGYEKGEREPRLSELKKLAHMFGMTLSELCMEADSRNIDQRLALHFEAVKQFNEEEMQAFNTLVESMVIRHHAKKAQEITSKPKS